MTEQKVTREFDRDASVAKSLFVGNIVEENIFPFPTMSSEESETVQMVVDSVARFLEGHKEHFREYDCEGFQPQEYIEALKELGLFGLIIPEEHGGIGLSAIGYSRVLQETSRFDGSTSLTLGAHSSIGMKGLLLFGTKEQKSKYLPRLATGEMIAAFCLTEPGSGSDAASIKTSAARQADGSWVLNGEKIWITNGPIAQFFTVFARTDGDEGKLSAFIVERGYQGVSSGAKEDKMGIRASATSSVVLENVRVPAENLLGEEGKGFKIAMSILNSGRSGLGGGCVGAMKECIRLASAHATERKQFGRPIAEFDLIRQKISQMTVDCYATESVVTMVAFYIDNGFDDFSIEAAASKVFGTEMLWRTANEALQIAGGTGYMKEYPYERFVRDSRINMIFEGTNEILRLLIALSGMKVAGEYLKEIGKSGSQFFNDPIKGFGVLGGYAYKRFSRLTSYGADTLEQVDPALAEAAEVFESYTREFSRVVEKTLRQHRKEIIGMQFVSRRIADIAIDLVVGLSVLSRVTAAIQKKGKVEAEMEIRIANIFSQQAKRRMNQNIRRLERNEDEEQKSLADWIVGQGKYPWDVL